MAKEKPSTKLCKYCKTEIPYDAKVCPQCRKRVKGGAMKWIVVAVAILVVIVIISGGGGKSPSSTAEISKAAETQSASTTQSTSTEKTEETKETGVPTKSGIDALLDNLKMGEKNAVLSAINYLDFTAFSRDGLIKQLSSEYGSGYTVEEATFAVDFLEEHSLVDWNEQAIKSAKNYLEYTAFSRNGLIDQLSSEYGSQFTTEEATQAVDYLEQNNLVDWKEQAVLAAKNYLEFTSFSRSGLIEQLSSPYGSKFTEEEATYAADQLGY